MVPGVLRRLLLRSGSGRHLLVLDYLLVSRLVSRLFRRGRGGRGGFGGFVFWESEFRSRASGSSRYAEAASFMYHPWMITAWFGIGRDQVGDEDEGGKNREESRGTHVE